MLVVLDTSVVVSAARSQRGASAQLIQWLEEDRFAIALSTAMVLEYEAVLRRQMPDTGWSIETVTAFLDFVLFKAKLIEPRFRLRPFLVDPGDAFVLELAFAAPVDYVMTLNAKDFIGSETFGVAVITPGELVKRLREPS